ncbi:hypothetical protein M9H77_01967 [Catharanthus roseus]|uniref:Uncharacterized protein n=1 Tax=Catharanthus roseus TaxID=4058 RepID=A0ACC0C779_CATRO|nr:hypothetical protein M9H77_01967 [Catharanthus roseus]
MSHDPYSISNKTYTHTASSIHQGLYDSDAHVLGLPPSTLHHKLYYSMELSLPFFVLHGASSYSRQRRKRRRGGRKEKRKRRRKEGEEEQEKMRMKAREASAEKEEEKLAAADFLEKKKMKKTMRDWCV